MTNQTPVSAPQVAIDAARLTRWENLELSEADAQVIIDLVRSRIAVQLDGKAYLIESRLGPVARRHGCSGLAALVAKVKAGDRTTIEDVLDAMTTNETSFFRDHHPFDLLAECIIPDVVARTGGIGPFVVWNAACSSGQEPLSLAMLLHEKFPGLARPGRTKLLATDYSPAMIRRVKEAAYSRFEVNRGLPADHLDRYFTEEGRTWVADRRLTDLIETRELNLIERWDSVPRCDVVMIRNVLIYFPIEEKKRILRRIRTDVLKPDGVLLLGSSESTVNIDPGYEPMSGSGSTYFVPR